MIRRRLNPVSAKTRRTRWPALAQTRAHVLARSEGRCEVCRVYVGAWIDVHHVVKRSQGGEDTPSNCLALCRPCHDATDRPRGSGRLVIRAHGEERFTWERL